MDPEQKSPSNSHEEKRPSLETERTEVVFQLGGKSFHDDVRKFRNAMEKMVSEPTFNGCSVIIGRAFFYIGKNRNDTPNTKGIDEVMQQIIHRGVGGTIKVIPGKISMQDETHMFPQNI